MKLKVKSKSIIEEIEVNVSDKLIVETTKLLSDKMFYKIKTEISNGMANIANNIWVLPPGMTLKVLRFK